MPAISVLSPPLHRSQKLVAQHPARFKVLACGRRWGKTRLGACLVLREAIRGRVAWWVAPSYPVAAVGWRALRKLAVQIPEIEIRDGERMVRMPSGGWFQVRSADNPDSLRGEGLDFVVIDEAAFVSESAWEEALRPALSDKLGRAMIVSTPKGHNWFWRAFSRGSERGQMVEWKSWQLPTVDNPFIVPSEVDAARASLPERVFAQEYLAEFIEDAGGVFRGVSACASGELERPRAGTFVLGVDWGKHEDFTVLVLLDARSRRVVDFDRFNQIDWHIQRRRLFEMYRRWVSAGGRVTVLAESNSIGEAQIEALRRGDRSEGIPPLPVQPFETTAASKAEIIENLQLAIETEAVSYPPIPELLSELQAYEQTRLPSGRVSYSAPSGMHDDAVMALAIALEGAGPAEGSLSIRPPATTTTFGAGAIF